MWLGGHACTCMYVCVCVGGGGGGSGVTRIFQRGGKVQKGGRIGIFLKICVSKCHCLHIKCNCRIS